MTDEDLAFLSELTFYHGTTRRTWDERTEGMDGGLYLTLSPNDALNYADETAIREHYQNGEADLTEDVEATVVTVSGARLIEFLAPGPTRAPLALEPDWGWVDGVSHDAGRNGGTAPELDWRASLEACRCVHVSGFAHADKLGLPLTAYDDFEAAHAGPAALAGPTA